MSGKKKKKDKQKQQKHEQRSKVPKYMKSGKHFEKMTKCQVPAGSNSSYTRQVNKARTSAQARKPKVAILIDAENVAVKYMELIMTLAKKEGEICCRHIYGDWGSRNIASWRIPSVRNGFTQIHQPANTKGKNSSDIALVIDAMDMMYREDYDVFFIASSDADFTRLVSRLHEDHKKVVGAGERKTSQAFTQICDKFNYLDEMYTANIQMASAPEHRVAPITVPATEKNVTDETTTQPLQPVVIDHSNDTSTRPNTSASVTARAKRKKKSKKRRGEVVYELEALVSAINTIIDGHMDDDGWTDVCTIGTCLSVTLPNADLTPYGGSNKLASFLRYTGLYEEMSKPNPNDSNSPFLFFKKGEASTTLASKSESRATGDKSDKQIRKDADNASISEDFSASALHTTTSVSAPTRNVTTIKNKRKTRRQKKSRIGVVVGTCQRIASEILR